MASCKDCIHDKVCSEYFHAFWGHTANKHSDLINADPKDCPYFKDRSRFVELPRKVYTTFIGRVVEAKIYGYEASMKNSNCSWTIEPQHFGKYVFFTQEAAEQALKEREAT